MESNVWELLGLVSKWFYLLATAGVVGGGFSLGLAYRLGFPSLPALTIYMLVSAVLGLCMTTLFFLVQVGSINDTGVAGMLDKQMGTILLQSSMGAAVSVRMLGFIAATAGACLLCLDSRTPGNGLLVFRTAGFVVLAAAGGLLGLSFALTGHTSALPVPARATLMSHVLAAFLWIGSLYPLLCLSTAAELTKVKQLMRYFGNTALLIVGVLLLTGLYLLTQLLQSFSELLSTDYGLVILWKLAGVTLLLSLAGLNKLYLVPRLTEDKSAQFIQASIQVEIGAALGILAITAWLTTVVGPAHL